MLKTVITVAESAEERYMEATLVMGASAPVCQTAASDGKVSDAMFREFRDLDLDTCIKHGTCEVSSFTCVYVTADSAVDINFRLTQTAMFKER